MCIMFISFGILWLVVKCLRCILPLVSCVGDMQMHSPQILASIFHCDRIIFVHSLNQCTAAIYRWELPSIQFSQSIGSKSVSLSFQEINYFPHCNPFLTDMFPWRVFRLTTLLSSTCPYLPCHTHCNKPFLLPLHSPGEM